MDSSSSSITSAGEATEALKSLLKVGNPTGVRDVSDASQSFNGRSQTLESVELSRSQTSSVSNGEVRESQITELLKLAQQTHPQSPQRQQVWLTGGDVQNSFSIYSSDVDIISSDRSSDPRLSVGSNKVKTTSIVNFDWEHKLYYGNLVAVHKNGEHVAYVLRGKTSGVVRVLNTDTTERTLLKGFSGCVMDIAFAHISAIVLGAVDEMGNMAIYEILEDSVGKIDATLLLHIVRPEDAETGLTHRLIWCPYLPEEEDPSTATGTTDSGAVDDAGKLLVLTHGKVAEMWNVDIVVREHDSNEMFPNMVEEGYLVINNHTDAIVDACYSPDGSALATASLDGHVKFFQVYLHDKGLPRCIHQWKPHDGKPVTSLFFLDDQKNPNPDVQFWKYAVTGANNNQEIKIWACESWSCLQTLNFMPNAYTSAFAPHTPTIKAALDLSANYLILSDIKRKVLYVLQIYRDTDNPVAHVTSISEFLLTQPCLSLAVVDGSRRKFRKLPEYSSNLDDMTSGEIGQNEDEEMTSTSHGYEYGIQVRLFSVHTKVLQELLIKFKPECSVPQPAPSSIASGSLVDIAVRDPLSDISMDNSLSERDLIAARAQSDRSRSFDDKSQNHSELSYEQSASRSFESHHTGSRSFDGSKIKVSGSDPATPTLIPPEAYTSSSPSGIETTPTDIRQQRMRPNKSKDARDTSIVLDSARSSATVQSNLSNFSDLTQVTAMEDDALQSARGSLMTSQQAVTSPVSSVTMTPASSRDISTSSQHAHIAEAAEPPVSVPLPPVTPGEESALATPPSYRSGSQKSMSDNGEQPPAASMTAMFASPRSSHSRDSTPRSGLAHDIQQQPHLGISLPQDFITSSPSANKGRGEFNPPTNSSQEDAEEIAVQAPVASVEEFFDVAASANSDDVSASSRQQRASNKLGSANSSSSASLEVSEILEGANKPDPYFENEGPNEDGETEGGEEEEDEEVETVTSPQPHTRSPIGDKEDNGTVESVTEEIEEVIEVEEEDTDNDDVSTEKPAPVHEEKAWPDPPEVAEAKRLAHEALHRAATFTIESKPKPVSIYPEQGVDDVHVEDEPEEIENEAENGLDDKILRDLAASGKQMVESEIHKAQFDIGEDDFDEENVDTGSGNVGLEIGQKAAIAQERSVIDDRRLPKNDPSLDDLSYSTSISSPSRLIPNRESNPAMDASGEPTMYMHVPPAPSSMLQVEKLEELQSSVQQMLGLLQAQQSEIEHLRGEILSNRRTHETLGSLQCQMDNLEGLLTSKVSETLAKHSSSESERLQQVLGQRESHDQHKHETLVSTVTQTLERTISNKLERIVKEEIRHLVLPCVKEVLNPIKKDLAGEVAQRLTATDSLVKENIAKLIRSRQTVEAMGAAAGNALQGPVQGACRDVLIPAFDRSCGTMFNQISEQFQRGTREYTQNLESHLEQVRRRHDQSRDPVVTQLTGISESMRAHLQLQEPTHAQLQELSAALRMQLQLQAESQTKMETVIHQAVYGMQENLVREVKRLIESEVVTAVKDQQETISTKLMDAMRSNMSTPMPQSTTSPDPDHIKTQVLHLLRQGQVNTAFQTALSASDLNLVMFVCETVNPAQIFEQTPCPLHQAVLLSLIQQLSADLTKQVEVKVNYLEEAVLNLDTTNTIVQEHIPSVLGQMSHKLTMYIQSNPNDRFVRRFKVLLKACKNWTGEA